MLFDSHVNPALFKYTAWNSDLYAGHDKIYYSTLKGD